MSAADERRERFDLTLDQMWHALRAPDRYWTAHGGWYHSTRDIAAHCWDRGYPLCQTSDPGRPIWHGPHDRSIGRLCEDCRVVVKSRVLHRMRPATHKSATA